MMSKKKNTLSEIGSVLARENSILIFPHDSIDGDALGSSVALCLGLRSAGKTSYVMLDEDIPDNIRFIENDCCTKDLDIVPEPDVCVCVDNGVLSRLSGRQELFRRGKIGLLVDHHKSSKPFLDYNYIDVNAAASAEIIYDLIRSMKLNLNEFMAEAIYVGIVTDTGRFQYPNTTKRTHEIASQLIDYNVDPNKVSVEIHLSVSAAKVRLESLILGTLKIQCNGEVATAYMTRAMLEQAGAKDEETDGIVEILRSLRGVNVALFAKESDKEGIKVSMRSKFDFDVARIAQTFGGGGHQRAAGFRCDGSVETVLSDTLKKIEDKIE